VIVGFTLKDFFEARFEDAAFAGTMILVTGCVVWSSRWAQGTARVRGLDQVPLGVAATYAAIAGTILPFVLVLGLQAAVITTPHLTAPAEHHRSRPGMVH
jgi:hypothetical protein